MSFNKHVFTLLIVTIFLVLLSLILLSSSKFDVNKESENVNIDSDNIRNSQLSRSVKKEIREEVKRYSDRSTELLVEEVSTDGSAKVLLKNNFMSVPVARIDKNGKIIISELSTESMQDIN